MKKIRVGLLGALVSNGNLGCCALTYGLVEMLESISKEHDIIFTYVIYERNYERNKFDEFAENMGIERERLEGKELARFIRFYRLRENIKGCQDFKQCDLFISITQGDSFADIYGLKHFIMCWIDQYVATLQKVPLIMGPQTYGPFENRISRYLAINLLNKASCIFTRDELSTKYLQRIKIKKEILTYTDLAFGISVENFKLQTKKNVGINISGLLWPEKIEKTPTNFTLVGDYRKLMRHTIEYLIKNGHTIHLISHVTSDYPVCQMLAKDYPEVICVDPFSNPKEAKSYIAAMELFIGARMHAAIAAFSTGVPLIPISYSRKFQGLFQGLDYNICIDIRNDATELCISKITSYIDNISDLKKQVLEGNDVLNKKYLEMKQHMYDKIMKSIYGSNNIRSKL